MDRGLTAVPQSAWPLSGLSSRDSPVPCAYLFPPLFPGSTAYRLLGKAAGITGASCLDSAANSNASLTFCFPQGSSEDLKFCVLYLAEVSPCPWIRGESSVGLVLVRRHWSGSSPGFWCQAPHHLVQWSWSGFSPCRMGTAVPTSVPLTSAWKSSGHRSA